MPENLTRREFMRALGLTGAGLTVANLAVPAPVVEAADTKPAPLPNRYWWVKNVDQPTVEIDWKNVKRFNEWQTTRGSLRQYRGEADDDKFNKLQKDNLLKFEKENKPGYTTKDFALEAAVNFNRPAFKFMGPQTAQTPQDRGMPRYEGTPEDNARIVTAALRHMGAATVGFVELNENTIKLIYAQEPSPSKRPILFENVEVGSEEKDKLIVPTKAKTVVVFTVQMSGETMKRGPTKLGSLTTALSYTRLWTILSQAHEFIRALGYQSYGPSEFNGFGIYPAFGVMAGLGELSRLNRLITPEYGPMVRETIFVTDLPLAPTKPIDFGVMQFCKDCMVCATQCPSKSLSLDREPTWEVKGAWNNPGHKAYFENSVTCRNYWNTCGTNCGICFGACPYANDDQASLHKILKGTIASTSLINPAFKAGFDLGMGSDYGIDKPLKDPEEWWRNTNLPEHGINTMIGDRKL
ncbi:MAG: reductive dehalogenase [Chloroflexota bacterium]